jgi:hypothetical protein
VLDHPVALFLVHVVVDEIGRQIADVPALDFGPFTIKQSGNP